MFKKTVYTTATEFFKLLMYTSPRNSGVAQLYNNSLAVLKASS